MHSNKHERLVKRIAEAYGVELEIRQGGSHHKVFLNNRMITVLPRGNASGNGRNMMNTVKHIERAINEYLNGKSDHSDESPDRKGADTD